MFASLRYASMRLSIGEGWCYGYVEAIGQVVMRWLMIVGGCIGEACVQESLWDRHMVLCVQTSIQVCQRRLRLYNEGVTLFIGKLNKIK